MFKCFKKKDVDINWLEDDDNDICYYEDDYYSVQDITQMLHEAKRFFVCIDSQNVYDPIIAKIITSIQWLLSLDYVYKCEKEETKRIRSDKKIFKIIIKHGTQNCLEACMYIEEILDALKNQPIRVFMQVDIRLKIIETIKEMMRINQTLYFMDYEAKRFFFDFLIRLVNGTEEYILKADIETKDRLGKIDEIKSFILSVDAMDMFNESHVKDEWEEYINEKVGKMKRKEKPY